MGVFLSVHGDQHIGARDGVFVGISGRDVHDGALNHTLETQSGLRVDLVLAREDRRVFIDELAKFLTQDVNIGRAGAQHLGSGGVVEQGEQ